MKNNIIIGFLSILPCLHLVQAQISQEMATQMVLDSISSMGIEYYMIGIHNDIQTSAREESFLYFVHEYSQSFQTQVVFFAVSLSNGNCRSWTDVPPDASSINEWRLYTNLSKPENEAVFDFSAWKETLMSPPRQNIVGGNTPEKYAVILNGGKDTYSNPINFWYDCSAVYSTLVYAYGYSPNNIYVLISDGINPAPDTYYRSDAHNPPKELTPGLNPNIDSLALCIPISSPLDLDGNGTNDIQYAATKENLTTVFNLLSEQVSSDDYVFIFVTDHGGKNNNGESTIALWGENQTISASEFTKEINKLSAQNISILMGQCFSGGFVPMVAREGRTIAPASPANDSAWFNQKSYYTEFIYYWISAALGQTPEGNYVDADYNNDGIRSMHEIFLFAQEYDTLNHNSQYASWPDNLGDYVSLNGLEACAGTDLFNTTISTNRTINDCSIQISYSTLKTGKKLILNHDIFTEIGLGFIMESGSELEIN